MTVQSALAQPYRTQCLLHSALVLTCQRDADGTVVHCFKFVRDLDANVELLDTAGECVKLVRITPTDPFEKDFVKLELEDGQLELTSTHWLEASPGSDTWYPWLAGDLRKDLFLRTRDGQSLIEEVITMPRLPVSVFELHLERNTTIWLDAEGVAVSVFGAQPEDYQVLDEVRRFTQGSSDLIYVNPPPRSVPLLRQGSEPCLGVFASVGSTGHPSDCAGACRHLLHFGRCKFGNSCCECHATGCTKQPKRKPGKRERERASRIAAAGTGTA